MTRALSYVEEILAWIEENGIEGIEYPVLVYLTCYRVLQAAAGDDPAAGARARKVLQEGHALLQERANRILDEGQRRQFLDKVPFNRELAAAWEAADRGNS